MLTQTFRDVMPKAKALGNRVVEQLDDIIAQFAGLWNVQHNDNGSHRDITADSITVGGTGTFDHVKIVGPLVDGLLLDMDSQVESASARLIAREGTASYIALSSDPLGAGAFIAQSESNETCSLASSNGASGANIGTSGRTLNVAQGIAERGRSVPMGEWQAQAFNAGDYAGAGAMTWTVDATAWQYSEYTLVGKTMTWKTYIAWFTGTSVVGGTPDTALVITIPGGHTMPSQGWVQGGVLAVNAGAIEMGFIQFQSTTQVAILRPAFANWTAGTVGVVFTATFEID